MKPEYIYIGLGVVAIIIIYEIGQSVNSATTSTNTTAGTIAQALGPLATVESGIGVLWDDVIDFVEGVAPVAMQ